MTVPLPAPQAGIIQGGTLIPGLAGVSSTPDNGKATYRASLNEQTFYSTAAAVVLEVQGSATKTVRLRQFRFWAQCGTKFYTQLTLQRTTGLSGTGSPNAVAMNPLDKNDVAATAVVNNYTGAATTGAGALTLGVVTPNLVPPSATIIATPALVYKFDKSFVLRGTGDVFELFNTITGLGTGTYSFEIEWEEDNS